MEKDQIVILKDRGLIFVSGSDADSFLQNIITNDIKKVSKTSTIFSGIFTPQGKYLFEFFITKSGNSFLLDCDSKNCKEIIELLLKYKLQAKVEIEDLSSKFVVAIISTEKFTEIQKIEDKNTNTISYREAQIFVDPRNDELGCRVISPIEKLYLTIKKLNLKIIETQVYLNKAYNLGIPIQGVENLKEKLFGLEANFEDFNALDFKKGCYIGQENTARMKLKNKIRKRLFAIKSNIDLKIGNSVKFENIEVGKVLIDKPFPFALINLYNIKIEDFLKKGLLINNEKIEILNIKKNN